jgi:hypothetical protein
MINDVLVPQKYMQRIAVAMGFPATMYVSQLIGLLSRLPPMAFTGSAFSGF